MDYNFDKTKRTQVSLKQSLKVTSTAIFDARFDSVICFECLMAHYHYMVCGYILSKYKFNLMSVGRSKTPVSASIVTQRALSQCLLAATSTFFNSELCLCHLNLQASFTLSLPPFYLVYLVKFGLACPNQRQIHRRLGSFWLFRTLQSSFCIF